jgi:hypothetical protein
VKAMTQGEEDKENQVFLNAEQWRSFQALSVARSFDLDLFDGNSQLIDRNPPSVSQDMQVKFYLDELLQDYSELVAIKSEWATWETTDPLEILQKILHEFAEINFVKQDDRYLRIWLLLAETQANPCDIFKYLLHKEIGVFNAHFYLAFSKQKERSLRYSYFTALFIKYNPFSKLTRCSRPWNPV